MPPGKYKKPPIVEAVVELRFGTIAERKTLEAFAREVAASHPTVEHTYEVDIQLKPGDGGPVVDGNQRFKGLKLTGQDPANVILANANSLGTVRQAPYEGWEALITEARRAFDKLQKLTGYRKFSRASTRFINRIDVPHRSEGKLETADYLLIEPRIPALLPSMSGFSTNFLAEVSAISGWVIVNSGIVPSPLIDHSSFALDIDLYRDTNVPQKESEIWELFETLRKEKNALFEAFITDQSRELFDA